MGNVLVHIGLTVLDIARARRFYENALGFRFDRELRLPADAIQPLLDLDPPSSIHAVYLMLGGFTLELMAFEPDPGSTAKSRTFNQTGLAHLSVAVGDIPATLETVRQLGGTVLTAIDGAAIIRDPEGQLIELLAVAFHEGIERERAERAAA